MCLFFFISGFFTPSSFDKKGRETFLKDKFHRLGIPVLAWYFVLGPLTNWGYASVIANAGKQWFDGAYKNTWFAGGPPWFILWLLNFNVFYAFSQGKSAPIRPPAMGSLFLAAMALGLVQYVVPTSDFMQVPMGLNQLSIVVVFFSCGVLAKRNAWLDAMCDFSGSTVWFMRCVALTLMGIVLVALVDSFRNLFSMVTPDLGPIMSSITTIQFFMGVMAVVMSFVMLQLFQERFGGTMHVVKWASSAAYTVYIIHPPFVIFGLYFYVKLLEGLGTDVEFNYANATFVIQSSNVMYMWLGFAFTGVVACGVFLWPIAFGLAKLPGFNRVL